MSESSAAAAAAAASDATESSPKRVKSQPPDVVVAVGRGEAQVEFECYGTLLSFASEVFDTMLSTNMREKNTHRIELPDKDPAEWKLFYDFVENSRYAKVEDGTRARILLPFFHEFQMTALVKECDDALLKEMSDRCPYYGKERTEVTLQLCHELLSMSYVYGLPRTQQRASDVLSFAIQDDYNLFDLDSIKNIIPLLKSNIMPTRAIEVFLPDHLLKDADGRHLSRQLREEKVKSLADNDLLPVLIHSGIRSKHEKKVAKQDMDEAKKALSHAKNELQSVVNALPSALERRLPNTRRMPIDDDDDDKIKIDAAARREVEKLLYHRWRREGWSHGWEDCGSDQHSRDAVRGMIQVPSGYRHGSYE